MIGPLALGTVELAAKLAPVLAQAVVDIIHVVHEHVTDTPSAASKVGLPMKVLLEQRRQAQAGASHGTVQGPAPNGSGR